MEPAPTPLEDALAVIEGWRAEGLRIVFTNGCFDLLHPGHVGYLDAARRLGDRLVVGLNDDASVRRLKGAERPVNPLADRALMLAALKPVDLVMPFSEDTPLNLIRRIRPDVLVKGGDYREQDIVGAAEVRKTGGRVVVLPFLDGHSSTGLIERIRGRR